MAVWSMLDIKVGGWSIIDFGSAYMEIVNELGLETKGSDCVFFLDVPVF